MDEIIRIAKARAVDVIHPGYGFLSENSEFASKCEAAGMRFVGPDPLIIKSMGDKTSARSLGKLRVR
jgi:pyruvate carboxylase